MSTGRNSRSHGRRGDHRPPAWKRRIIPFNPVTFLMTSIHAGLALPILPPPFPSADLHRRSPTRPAPSPASQHPLPRWRFFGGPSRDVIDGYVTSSVRLVFLSRCSLAFCPRGNQRGAQTSPFSGPSAMIRSQLSFWKSRRFCVIFPFSWTPTVAGFFRLLEPPTSLSL